MFDRMKFLSLRFVGVTGGPGDRLGVKSLVPDTLSSVARHDYPGYSHLQGELVCEHRRYDLLSLRTISVPNC